MWCPELKDVPVLNIHDPWNLSKAEVKKFGIGDKYPLPISCPKYTNLSLAKKQKEEKKVVRDLEKKE